MIYNIASANIAAVSAVVAGRLNSAGANGLLIEVTVGGSGHAEGNFDQHIINVTLRQRKGENKQLVNGVRMTDALKYSDYKFGFSLQQKGVAAGRYVAFLPMGRVRLEGDDQLDLSISCAGHATATYTYRVSAVNLKSGPEDLVGYELVVGNGNEIPVKDVYALMLLSPASGASITVSDQEGSVSLTDYDVIDLGNVLGEMEVYEDIGTLYVDKYNVSQDIRVKLPASTYALAVKGFFDPERLLTRQDSEDTDIASIIRKIDSDKPEKTRVLRMLGRV